MGTFKTDAQWVLRILHYRNLSAHFIQPIGKRKLSAGKVTVTVYLLLKNVLDKGYTLYSNRISCSKSSFRKVFCFAASCLAYSCLWFYTVSNQKTPPFLPKRVGKCKIFLSFFAFFRRMLPLFLISSCSHGVLVILLFSPCILSYRSSAHTSSLRGNPHS